MYIRLHWLKRYDPDRYCWLLPLPGEWHFQCHVLMALHRLWYKALVESLVEELGFQKTIKGPKWDNVEHFVYYDRFYQLLISCQVRIARDIKPPRPLPCSP